MILGHSFGSIVVAAAVAAGLQTSRVILVNPIGAPALEGPRGILTRLAVFYYWAGAKLPRRLGEALLRNGLIVQNGTQEEILTDPANDYVAQFVQDVDRARVLTASAVMEPPTLSTPITAGVRGALRAMRENQAGAVFAIENRRLVGVVTDRAVIRAVKSGETDLRRIVDTHVPTVGPDDLLTDIVETAVEATVPLAVVDADGRLRGVIPRITLLAALGNVPATTREMPVVQTPLEMVAEFTPLVDAVAGGGR